MRGAVLRNVTPNIFYKTWELCDNYVLADGLFPKLIVYIEILKISSMFLLELIIMLFWLNFRSAECNFKHVQILLCQLQIVHSAFLILLQESLSTLLTSGYGSTRLVQKVFLYIRRRAKIVPGFLISSTGLCLLTRLVVGYFISYFFLILLKV